MASLRILVLCRYYPYPLDRGSNLRVFPILKYLARRHTLDLLTFEREGADPAPGRAELARYCRRVGVIREEQRTPGRIAGTLSFLSRSPRMLTLSHSADMDRAVAERMAGERYDAILCEWLYVAPYATGWPRAARVLDNHNAEAAAYWRALRLEGGGLARRARGWASWAKLYDFERRIVRMFDGVAAVSNADADRLRAMSNDPSKIMTVPNGMDLDAVTRWTGDRTRRQLVYAGSLTYEPNLDACVHFAQEILPLVRRTRPDVKLVITGKLPPTVPAVLRDDGAVELRGLVPDVHPVIGRSELAVVPLRRGGGTRLKILEAFAIGTPVVSTSVGAEGIDAQADRELAIADKPVDFAHAIVRLLDDPGERARLADGARALMERRYAWSTIADSLDRLLADSVARQRLRSSGLGGGSGAVSHRSKGRAQSVLPPPDPARVNFGTRDATEANTHVRASGETSHS